MPSDENGQGGIPGRIEAPPQWEINAVAEVAFRWDITADEAEAYLIEVGLFAG